MYAMLLDAHRHEILNMTEIGIGSGKSLLTWHDYLPNAHIFGIDIIKEQGRTLRGRLNRLHEGAW